MLHVIIKTNKRKRRKGKNGNNKKTAIRDTKQKSKATRYKQIPDNY